MRKCEASFVTSSIGMISFLLWHEIYPTSLTLPPNVACLYFNENINWGEIVNSYWMGEKIPVCELAECVVVSQRILKEGKIKKLWYKELREALGDVREDYIFPIMI